MRPLKPAVRNMKIVLSIYIMFLVICISGCLGGAPRIIRYDIYKSDLNIETGHFLDSFSKLLKDKGYKIINQNDRKGEKHTVSDGKGSYPILLEANKGSIIVRICDLNSGNFFIQVVQVASILIWKSDKHLENESSMIKKIINVKFPYLRIEQHSKNF
jgi:hypothetical protein